MSFYWTFFSTGNNQAQAVLIESVYQDIQVHDLNADGWLDIIFPNWGWNASYVNNAGTDPSEWEAVYFEQSSPLMYSNVDGRYNFSSKILDINGDGVLEVFFEKESMFPDGIYGFSFSSDGSCTELINLIPNVYDYAGTIYDSDWSDVDGDGDLDLIAIQGSQSILYYSENLSETLGCTDEFALNYEEAAITDDLSCVYLGTSCDDGMSATYNDAIQADGSCQGQAFNGTNVMRINCGYTSGDVTDTEGNIWQQEEFAIGGGNTVVGGVENTPDDAIMRFTRYDFTGYNLPVPSGGEYLVRLHFGALRNEVQTAGFEIFDVLLEGGLVEQAMDPFVEAGNQRLTHYSREYFIETQDEMISLLMPVIAFSNEISGIEVFQYTGDCVDLDWDEVCDDLEVFGCEDPEACNFNENATEDDGSCEVLSCAGCMDSEACNYDSEATYADASCDFPPPSYDCNGQCLLDFDMDGVCDSSEMAGCTYPGASNYSPGATDDDGSCLFDGTLPDWGCTYTEACNYNPEAGQDDGSCEYPSIGRDCDGLCINDQDQDGICDEFEGCTIPTSCNYNAAALDNDGCCIFPEEGADCTGNCINDTDGDGICDEAELAGCTDLLACNYSQLATDENGTCVYQLPGEDCLGNCLSDLDGDGTCDPNEIVGCNDVEACNYNPEVTDPDGSCTYPAFYYDCEGQCLNDADNDGICDAFEIGGCTYPMASNFLAQASDDDGSCVFEDTGINGCFYSIACNYNTEVTVDDGSCIFPTPGLNCEGECLLDCDGDGICDDQEIGGCLNEAACNYFAGATDAWDNCEFLSCAGCMELGACNYDAEAPYSDGSCEYSSCAGCTSIEACNFDSEASIENGSCEFESCAGCTYPDADNYDPTATTDDGSCIINNILEIVADSAYTDGYNEGALFTEIECEEDVSAAFTSGFEIGLDYCDGTSASACGPGTIWNEVYNLCLAEPVCSGDLDGNEVINMTDLLIFLSVFGSFCN